jgi:hypothetical protein
MRESRRAGRLGAVEIASLIVAILAVLIAAIGAFYSYREARAANQQAVAALESVEIYKSQDWDYRKPEFVGAIQYVGPSAHRLNLTLASPWPLAEIRATLADGKGVRMADFHGNEASSHVMSGPLATGDSIQAWVSVDEEHSDSVTLKVVSRGQESERWTVFPKLPVFPEFEARKPKLDTELEWIGPPQRLRMRLKLASSEPVKSVRAKILPPEGFVFVTKAVGADREKRSTNARCGRLVQGATAEWRLAGRGLFFRLELVFEGERGEQWTDYPMLEVPKASPGEWLT